MNNLKFSVVEQQFELPKIEEVRDGRKEYISYGVDNLFPQYIMDLYNHSAIMEAIVHGTKDYVMGNDIIPNDLIKEFAKCVNKQDDTLSDIIEKVIIDYILFDGFAIQVFKNDEGKVVSIYNLDFQSCRLSKNEDYVLYSSDWSKYNSKSTKYPKWNKDSKEKNSILYFKGKNAPQTNAYPIPSYIGALSDIKTSCEISNFHLNSVINGFNSSLIINFNNGDVDEDTKKEVERKIEKKFCGTDNASRFLLSFNENKDSAVTIERLNSDDFADRCNSLSKTIIENIFVAFRCSPQLMGLTSLATGFNTQEYESAFKLFQKTVAQPIQNIIIRVLDKLFGIQDSVMIVPFSLNEKNNEITNE